MSRFYFNALNFISATFFQDCERRRLMRRLPRQGKAIKGLEKDVDSQRAIIFERVKESEKEFREKFQGFVASIDEKLENMQITQNLFGLEADIDQRNMTFGEQQD